MLHFVTSEATKNITNYMVNKMLGGTQTTKNAHNFIIGIFLKSPSIHICSGCVFTKRAVLSTALCYIDRKAVDITIKAGTFDLYKGGINYDVDRIVSQNIGIDSIAVLFSTQDISNIMFRSLPISDESITGGTWSNIFGWMTDIVSIFLL